MTNPEVGADYTYDFALPPVHEVARFGRVYDTARSMFIHAKGEKTPEDCIGYAEIFEKAWEQFSGEAPPPPVP